MTGFWHAAMLYHSADELMAEVTGFVAAGVQRGEPVLIMAAGHGLDPLRTRVDGEGHLVTWLDMGQMGVNPGRLMTEISGFAQTCPGRVVRCVQQAAWPARSPAEMREVIRHEALVNLALARSQVRVLCPYGGWLGGEMISCVERTHPALARSGQWQPNPVFGPATEVPRECETPLSKPPAAAESLSYQGDIGVVRDFTAIRARQAGLPPDQVRDLVIAVGELAANTLAHTSGPGTLTMWTTRSEVICQVHDSGQITDPLAGRLRPDPVTPGGLGLWVVHQLCDLVEVRTGPHGTTSRVHMRLSKGIAAMTAGDAATGER